MDSANLDASSLNITTLILESVSLALRTVFMTSIRRNVFALEGLSLSMDFVFQPVLPMRSESTLTNVTARMDSTESMKVAEFVPKTRSTILKNKLVFANMDFT